MGTENEKAILRAIRDPQYLGYEPSYFAEYPPLKLAELVERTGLSVEVVASAVDTLVQKKILRELLRPPEFAIEGQEMPPFDFYVIGYGICDNAIAECVCERLEGN